MRLPSASSFLHNFLAAPFLDFHRQNDHQNVLYVTRSGLSRGEGVSSSYERIPLTTTGYRAVRWRIGAIAFRVRATSARWKAIL